MSAHGSSPLSPRTSSSGHSSSHGPGATALPVVEQRRTSFVRAALLPLAATAAGGGACVWAARRASQADRPLVTAAGALAAVLLGLAVALLMSRRRLRRDLHAHTEALRAESARTAAAYAEAARRMTADLESVQRTAREAEVRRRTAAESEASLRAALKTETARSAALEGETARLADVAVPLAVERLRSGGAADAVLSRLPQPSGAAHQRLLEAVVREIGASERMRAAAMAMCASAAGRAQALTTSVLASLREMENRHGEEVLTDLLRLDHATAQTGRLADSIAVVAGARSGRRWTKPIVMESVLRGALGRISAYQRVRLHSVSTAAVAGHAAEGVMHALAEIMDNACTFSPPSEDVHVYVEETTSGAVVTVEDAGPSMADAALARAQRLVAAEPTAAPGPVDPQMWTLSGTRLGLAVVGSLARKHGLLVSFRPSSRGGTGVVLLIPAKLLTRPPADFPVPDAEAAGRREEAWRIPGTPDSGDAPGTWRLDALARQERQERDEHTPAHAHPLSPHLNAPGYQVPRPEGAGGVGGTGSTGSTGSAGHTGAEYGGSGYGPSGYGPSASAPSGYGPSASADFDDDASGYAASDYLPSGYGTSGAEDPAHGGAAPGSPGYASTAQAPAAVERSVYDDAPSYAGPGFGTPGYGIPGAPHVPLPKRMRGHTLAASQHGDLTADPAAAYLDPTPEEEARAARARAGAGARFSAFHQAAGGGERVRETTAGPQDAYDSGASGREDGGVDRGAPVERVAQDGRYESHEGHEAGQAGSYGLQGGPDTRRTGGSQAPGDVV